MTDRDETARDAAGNGTAMRMSIAGLAKSGAVAGVIKLASAALSFAMFVTVAMVTDGRQFGLYSAAYAGASLVSFFASVGQQSTVLRFWPQYAEAGDLPSAHGMMVRSIAVAFAGVILSSLLVVAFGFAPYFGEDTVEWLPLCVSAAILSGALGWSEFASGAFRAKGALISGLLPRDVVWRALTIAAVLALRFEGIKISAVMATLLTAGLLILSVLPQTVALLRDTLGARPPPLSDGQKAEFNTVTMGLWGATSLPPALGQVGTLLVAGILGPEIAGAVFVADRTTRLVLLALNGINQALAPEISAAFYGGDKAHVQKMTSLTALGSFAAALVILLAFWLLGPLILAAFDASYATPAIHTVLILFGLGATVAAACGPVELLMQLTGLQHSLVKLLVAVNVVGLAVTALLTWLLGPLGVGLGTAGTVMIATIWEVMICSRSIGINPSVAGLLSTVRPKRAGFVPRDTAA
ncbi:MAG: lipopolysaccharide biosynthesis protein [Mesorhizobium sp.]